MALEINAQFNKFLQFAELQRNPAKSEAIARITGFADSYEAGGRFSPPSCALRRTLYPPPEPPYIHLGSCPPCTSRGA